VHVDTVTKAQPYTKAGIRRRIAAALEAGLYVTGIAPDGTVLLGPEPRDKPSDNDPPKKTVRL
jgi:hypothetical protein